MRKTFLQRMIALSAGSLMAVSLALPVSAAPLPAIHNPQASGNVVLAQYHRHYRHERHHRGFYVYRGHPYYRGHRGYRYYRRGYREYNGYWFPPAAFIAGAIIGGALASPPRSLGSAHVRWCERHYRSYDVRTDTFQPYHGPRRRCISPY